MLLSEEELTIQVAQVDRIKVDNVYLSEAGHDKILEQFTPDSACANKKHSCLKSQSAESEPPSVQ
jgi:hypothetical protein